MSLILTDFDGKVGTITFNRPEKRNCFSADMLKELIAALDALEHKKARAVIIRAQKGAKVWSAGMDISELPDPGLQVLGLRDALEHSGMAFPSIRVRRPLIMGRRGAVASNRSNRFSASPMSPSLRAL